MVKGACERGALPLPADTLKQIACVPVKQKCDFPWDQGLVPLSESAANAAVCKEELGALWHCFLLHPGAEGE